MKLIKDDSGNNGFSLKAHLERCKVNPKEIEQILKNQEDAEKWNELVKTSYTTDHVVNNEKIVERLKKRIEVCKLPENNEDQEVLEALQKILGEKK